MAEQGEWKHLLIHPPLPAGIILMETEYPVPQFYSMRRNEDVEKRLIQVEERVPVKLLVPLSVQHMFAMFGASVLVPFMFGINPAVVLLMNGVGTLLFILITKGKAPAYLGSSFAFLSPALLVIDHKEMRHELD